MSVCLAGYLPMYLSICLPACLPVCLSVGRSVSRSVNLSTCIYLSIYLSIMVCPSIYPSIYLSIHLSIYFKKNKNIPYWNWAEMTQGRNDPPTKAETAHPQNWPKQPNRNDPGRKRPGTEQGPAEFPFNVLWKVFGLAFYLSLDTGYSLADIFAG